MAFRVSGLEVSQAIAGGIPSRRSPNTEVLRDCHAWEEGQLVELERGLQSLKLLPAICFDKGMVANRQMAVVRNTIVCDTSFPGEDGADETKHCEHPSGFGQTRLTVLPASVSFMSK